jgi:hypothetical protein
MKRILFFVGLALCITGFIAGNAAAQDCVESPAGLVSWWPGDGNATDIVSGFDGTLVNGATFAPGFVSQAFSFDGIGGGRNDRVDLPNQALNGLSDFTVDLWLNTTDSSATFLSGANALTGNEFLLGPASGGTGTFSVWVKGILGPLHAVNDGAWHHIAFAREGLTGRLYFDGGLIDSRSYPIGTLGISPGGLMLGQEQDCVGGCFDPNQALDGLIDELEIYNRALEASEIQAIFDAGSAGKCGKPPPPPTVEELLERIEALEDHTHTYRTGVGEGHNNTEAETGEAEAQVE